MEDNKPTITASELADRYGVKRTTIVAWARKGYIPSIKFGKEYRFYPDDVMEFERANYNGTTKTDGR